MTQRSCERVFEKELMIFRHRSSDREISRKKLSRYDTKKQREKDFENKFLVL
jgi:hypothetical protein